MRGVDLFPSHQLIPRNLLILRWSGMPKTATKGNLFIQFSFRFPRGVVLRRGLCPKHLVVPVDRNPDLWIFAPHHKDLRDDIEGLLSDP